MYINKYTRNSPVSRTISLLLVVLKLQNHQKSMAGPAVQAWLRLHPEEGRPAPALRASSRGQRRQPAPADAGRRPDAGDDAVDGTRVDVKVRLNKNMANLG